MKRNVKRILVAAGSIFMLLFLVLVIHIATAKPVTIELATWQVSRFDFKQPIDSITAKKIEYDLSAIAGVKGDILVKNNVVVFFHDNTVTNNQKVFDAFTAKGYKDVSVFTVPAALANKKVCPAMKQDGFAYHFSKGIQRIFN